MRKNIVLVVLIAVAVLMIYKFRTPAVIAEEGTGETAISTPASILAEEEITMAQEAPSEPMTETTQRKISTLKEILATKNDNDPRMDTDLKNLSNEDKDALVRMYQDLKSESLNDKGTIVFLIGRDMNRPEDAEFLKSVLSEEPCLSFDNCGVTNPQTDPHMDAVNDVSLNYPQIVALNRMKTYLASQNIDNVNPTILNHLMDAVKIGQTSKVGTVQARSNELSNLLTKKKK